MGEALATEAVAEFIRSGGVWEAESNVDSRRGALGCVGHGGTHQSLGKHTANALYCFNFLTQRGSVAPASVRQSDVAWSVFLALYCSSTRHLNIQEEVIHLDCCALSDLAFVACTLG